MTPARGRPMDRRLRVRGWLRTQTPLHVGGVAVDPAEALPVAVDGQDRVYVPGTSLAGALRAWMRGADPRPEVLDDLWGFADDGEPGGARASRVVVRDAVITATTGTDGDGIPDDPLDPRSLPVRHGVGIDRVTGAAAPGFLYARTIVPPGRYLAFELDIETTLDHLDRDRARLHALLAALKAEEVGLGAGNGRGLGVVTLLPSPLAVHEHDFTGRAGLLAFLGGEPEPFDESRVDESAADLPARREMLTVQLRWRPDAPVMVRATGEGAAINTLPLTTEIGRDAVRLTLSGSSLKGALRGHAEFIERTARGLDAPPPPLRDGEDDDAARRHAGAFLDQLDELDAVRALFGAARREDARGHPWGAGALRVHECVSETAVPSEVWDIVVDGLPDDDPDPALRPPVRDALAARGLDQADHVAIDRWTGGAADHLLFSVLEPHGIDWEPIRLTVDLTRLGGHRDVAVALLLLVLRDLERRRIPLGGMVNRGFGDVTITSVEFRGNGWTSRTTLADALRGEGPAAAWREYTTLEPTGGAR
ncbi:RAMP superfamily CRISPR-associated protein [Actinomadura roseirufa]|uniref:RAMP superfamily CRISPR-associated protein n=1 Tax=Actinomadura roseirufa TaxID=2094049 RepID=UPI0010418057|nr:RAMP superfamily CRISPR-associated protein [Actinomadura roseirufa]